MKKIRGFLLKRRVFSIFRCIHRKNQLNRDGYGYGYHRVDTSSTSLFKWVDRIKEKARSVCSKSSGFRSGYLRLGKDPAMETGLPAYSTVPKGKMAVYVGKDDGDFERVLVPVIYINHPLFGQLLRKAEEEYGYHHAGGITIPCRVSEFENVKTRIAAGGGRNLLPWKRHV